MKLFERQAPRPEPRELPFVSLEGLVLFPGSTVPLHLSAAPAAQAVDEAMSASRELVLTFLRSGGIPIGEAAVHGMAVLARVSQVMKLPNGALRLLAEIRERVSVEGFTTPTDTRTRVVVRPLELGSEVGNTEARLMRAVAESFQRYAGLTKKIPREIIRAVEGAESPHRMVDLVAAQLNLPLDQRFRLLDALEAAPRLEELAICLEAECELLSLKGDIDQRVKQRLDASQKAAYINEQIRELNRELGSDGDDQSPAAELEKQLAARALSQEARDKTTQELKRLARLQPMSPEHNVLRTWLETVAALPWGAAPERVISLTRAQAVLDADHYDLEDAKDRIIDFLAARRANPAIRAPIICLVGPPGTGKTSLARSLASALGRSFVRISLGGVHDEAEIRGHRRTYLGALPGRIIQSLRKTGEADPLILLDEVDKMRHDHRGDPAGALLEVLDPEQNRAFADNYLEVGYDLSAVLFVCTANDASAIPPALRDRLELISVPGYSRYDKRRIATGFIIPRQLAEHGLSAARISFDPAAVDLVIDEYTAEAGVRQLDRAVASLVRKLAREHLPDEVPPAEVADRAAALELNVGTAEVRRWLRKPVRRPGLIHDAETPGTATGMAWTEAGGTVMPVEVRAMAGSGEIHLTGSLGDVMKESGRIALTLLRALHAEAGLTAGFERGHDIHIHVPEGAVPKDGPSAGVTLFAALASAFSGRPVRAGLAMTGEITLGGRVLPVGGVREKVLAAHRHGLRSILLPEDNRIDADDIPSEVAADLSIMYVARVEDVLRQALA